MSNNDWTDKLRDVLADYQEPASNDLWAGIEQSLAQQGNNVGKDNGAHVIVMRKWVATAAAAALLAIGGSYVYLAKDGSKPIAVLPSKTPLIVKNTNPEKENQALAAVVHALQPSSESHQNVVSEGTQLMRASENSQLLETSESSQLLASSSAPQTAELMAQNMESQNVGSQEMAVTQSQTRRSKTQPAPSMNRETAQFASKQKYTVRCDATLFAENGVITSNGNSMSNSYMVASAPASDPGVFYDQAKSAPFVAMLKAVNSEKVKHHAPISMGVQVGVHLAPRLTLSTGAVYTRTSSDFSHDGGKTYETKQVLHYVGIPLGVNYEVWGTKRLHTYVNGGGEVDFNVKNDTEVDDTKLEDGISKDRAQFSAKISAGLQYDVVPQLGIYVEPGAKYYFDNGSDIENTFKDKKLNFNFQFGLRWNIGK